MTVACRVTAELEPTVAVPVPEPGAGRQRIIYAPPTRARSMIARVSSPSGKVASTLSSKPHCLSSRLAGICI